MPQKTVFVRDGDLDKWNSIEKKSEFIHQALNGGSNYQEYDPGNNSVATVVDKVPQIEGVAKGFKLCKHGMAIGLCKHGCKK